MRGLVSALVLASVVAGATGAASAQILSRPEATAAPAPGQVMTTRPSYTVEPFIPTTPIDVKGTGVRFRAEPFTGKDTPVLSAGSTGLSLTVVGVARMPDWNWYQVVLKNGQKAFIRSDLTSAPSRAGSDAAQVARTTPAPATPTPAPTTISTPQPTSIPVAPKAPVTAAPDPGTYERPSLDLPSPTAPAGLQSKPQ